MNENIQYPFSADAKWIGQGKKILASFRYPVIPAPYFRKVFQYRGGANPRIHICGLGYYELYLNGKKVGDQVLDPVVSQYDRRSRYITLDATGYLQDGDNVVCAVLGNGWYNTHSLEVWHFDKVSWRDYPKMLLQLEDDNGIVCVSDLSWKISTGGLVFDGLRNGEIFDSQLEPTGWLERDFDDSQWDFARMVYPPGGILTPQFMPPCKVMQTLKPVDFWRTNSGSVIFDAGQNLTGWSAIPVKAATGTKFTLKYAEILDDAKNIDQKHIAMFIKEGVFQTDQFIAKGGGIESYSPRFTYHGFRYVEVAIEGEGEIAGLEIQVVYTSFDTIGHFKSSNADLNTLQKCTYWSYLSNFTGIPTDCPHREKNGWTGDALLAAETGLFNFDASSSYRQWLESLRDVQRPNGQLPGIVPSGGWGFNWGSGPAWDSALIMIPWYIYVFTGDTTTIRENYDAMKKYMEFCRIMSVDHLLDFGLGDWCAYNQEKMAPVQVTSTGYYYCDTVTMGKCAALMGHEDDVKKFTTDAAAIRKAFNRKFYHGDGVYADDGLTSLATALYHGLVDEEERPAVAARLAAKVKDINFIADFGILGAKYVPRVLADNGYIDEAYRIITQPEYPGWVNWLRLGATTLWENWKGTSSRNHIMFGDISAWMYQYLAGITPLEEAPGFKRVRIKPMVPADLDTVEASHQGIASRWQHNGDNFELEVEIPDGKTAEVVLPDGSCHQVAAGKHQFSCQIRCQK